MISPDEQSTIDMIRQSAGSIASRKDLRRVRAQRFSAPGFDNTVWHEICDAGWVAIRVPEDKGGAGLGMLPFCALIEELGAGLVPEPLIPAVFAGSFLRGDALEQQITGRQLILPAWQDSRDALSITSPLKISDGKLWATKQYVGQAEGADALLVVGEGQAAIVPAKAKGVEIVTLGAQDGTFTARVSFSGVEVQLFDVDPAPALAEAALATSAYLLGIMDAALELTVDYLKTRIQFGKVIGTFQALQHMAVDARLELELTRASVEDAALRWDHEGATHSTYAAISRAKVRAALAALKVTRDAVQMHGGIGFTDEHDIGLYLRKAIVTASQFGSAKAHKLAFAQLKPARAEI
ncbi:acyl-CoA dehydrogenase family protein [Sinorhizobium medicae]|uniref:acyl-CoA dehydrogenase family protein n=1 Tax=Sinorhizobium medicae TaxID=110321 RepID=UPI000FD8C45F|nr:acyl-CoA dehydrogenase family protein [Sinorhizobium medicae]RVO73514.1 acyl-CoA dehydrogenase [Sinorhizobium medicae]